MTLVLCIDDNEMNRFLIGTVLRRAGWEVATAATGEEGIATALRIRPDLVLMDLSLPGMSGLDATRRMRALPALHGVPIIAVSAHDEDEAGAAAADAGCDGYATKPVDWRTLLSQIHALLAPKDARAS